MSARALLRLLPPVWITICKAGLLRVARALSSGSRKRLSMQLAVHSMLFAALTRASTRAARKIKKDGRVKQGPAMTTSPYQRNRKVPPRLTPAATSPGQAATAATAAAATASPASSAAAATTAASAAAATSAAPCNLFAEPVCSSVFLVEDVERPQADVGDFLFTESDFVTRRAVRRRRHIHCRPTGRCGCAPR